MEKEETVRRPAHRMTDFPLWLIPGFFAAGSLYGSVGHGGATAYLALMSLAGILTPSDFSFARDGILAEGIPNQETMVVADLNLDTISEGREAGTVLPLLDSGGTASLLVAPTVVPL